MSKLTDRAAKKLIKDFINMVDRKIPYEGTWQDAEKIIEEMLDEEFGKED